MSSSNRLASLDALRGITVAGMLLVNNPGDGDHVYWPLEHAAWNGCTPTDLIFPFFLFVMGVSVSLAILPRLQAGGTPGLLCDAALWRALRILMLGLILNAFIALCMPDRVMRWPGVLQRIAICFAVVALFAIYVPKRGWWVALVALMASYTGILAMSGTLTEWDNLVDHVDSAVFGQHVWDHNALTGQVHDPEGLLSTLPSIASSLLGLIAGVWLSERRFKTLLVAALGALAFGWLWSFWISFNKNLWTPSFVMWTSGLAMLALLACYWLIDVRGWPAWGRRFGANAIAAYAGAEFMQVLMDINGWQGQIYHQAFANVITPWGGPQLASLAFAIAFVVFWWLVMWVMDRRRVYLRL